MGIFSCVAFLLVLSEPAAHTVKIHKLKFD